jgi:AcrR family transcriptional regulator
MDMFIVNLIDYRHVGLRYSWRQRPALVSRTEYGMAAVKSNGASTATGARRPRRARDSLSRELIVEAAEKVVDRDGLDGLTFQAIGEELGAHPTSVYRHFRDKHELVMTLIDTIRARSYTGRLTPTDDWIDDLRRSAHTVRENFLRHPEFALAMATRRPSELSVLEFTIDALRRGGYPAEDAALYARALGNLVRAASSIEAAMTALPPEAQAADQLAFTMSMHQVDAERFPRVAEAANTLPLAGDPRAWEAALELMLESLQRRADTLHA